MTYRRINAICFKRGKIGTGILGYSYLLRPATRNLKSPKTINGCFRLLRLNLAFLGYLICFLSPLSILAQTDPLPLPGRILTLAFFLDSVDIIEPQTLWLTNIITYRKSPDGKELDIPAFAASFGLDRRIQVDISVPYVRSQYGTDFRINGIGDRFLSAKILAVDPDSHGVGLALEPTLEILGEASLAAGEMGPGKYNFALPLIVQKNFSRFNLYGEGGYITRGALFAGLGADGAVAKGLGLGFNLLYSRSTRFNELTQQFGLLKSRVDATMGFYYILNSHLSLFTSGGRTISAMDPNGTSYILNFGMNVNMKLRDLLNVERRSPQ
jgi:hypothetical protein